MEVLVVLRVLRVAVLLLVAADRSGSVRCFARFELTLGQCAEELGEVGEDDCCQNPHYGYQATDGECHSCGPPVWSPWSPWSPCNVLCGEGVTQRSRKCFGIGQCENADDKLQMQACSGSCCNSKGWGLWLNWSPCTVTCGGGGVRKRERLCTGAPECRSACSGSSEEMEACPTLTCPVHGGWSRWSGWSQCSGSCISNQFGKSIIPSRRRERFCSNPAPSFDTEPHGNSCPGDNVQVEDCSELPNCPVDGVWGSWSPFSSCPVTCGVGLEVSTRRCDSPAPKHGGQPCLGEGRRTSICKTHVHCPVDGAWSEWSSWGDCLHPVPAVNDKRCHKMGGSQTRERICLYRNHSGTSCVGGGLTNSRVCHDVRGCYVEGNWEGWEPWSLCQPSCGDESRHTRTRYCKPDYSEYSPTIGLLKEKAVFFGKARVICGPLPDGSEMSETQPCRNAPPCP